MKAIYPEKFYRVPGYFLSELIEAREMAKKNNIAELGAIIGELATQIFDIKEIEE